ncbi:MAG: alpha/beta hydrolase [Pseudomonadota bacterium]
MAIAYLAIIVLLWALQSRMLYPAPQQTVPLIPGYSEVQLDTSDGLSLRAFYSQAEAGMPTVVYFHGNGGSLTGAGVSNAALVDRGIGALLVEYRGYGGNPGEPSEEGLYRDGEAAIAWLEARGIPLAQTVMIGNSIGSGVAVEMALRYDPAALILISPFTSLPDAAAANLWWLPAFSLVRDQYASKDKIKQLGLPVLVQHGTADNLIPHGQGLAMARAAPNGDFHSFEGEGHALSFIRSSGEARADWIEALGLVEVDAQRLEALP